MKMIESLANVAIISLVGLTAFHVYTSRQQTNKTTSPAEQALIGAHLPSIKEMESVPIHVAIALSSRCRFCEQEADFYRSLQSIRDSSPRKLKISVLFSEPEQEAKRALDKWGIRPDSANFSMKGEIATKIQGTPTLLIADSSGTIRQAFIGAIPQDRKNSIISYLKQGT